MLLILFVTISCEKDDSELSQSSSAYSIIVNNGKVLVSGWENINTHNSSVFWIDTFRDNSSNFNKFLVKGNIYKSSIDESDRDTYVYKSLSGETEVFKFNQAEEKENEKMFCYRNNNIVKMDTSALEVITTMNFSKSKPFFAGNFREIINNKTGEVAIPRRPFLWDG